MIPIRRLSTAQPDFEARLAELLAFESAQDPKVDADVAAIVADVKARGDAAVLEYTRRYDRLDAKSVAALEVPRAQLAQARQRIPQATRSVLETAARRVRAYHGKQLPPRGATGSLTGRSSASA
jgi:histidinol dehydrogenase